jgi:serine/threonine protein kinase
MPNGYRPLQQGWKIHLSATPSNALDVIRKIAPAVTGQKVPFKFCSDLRMVQLATSKHFARSGAGKFITIYPHSVEQFLDLMEECHSATRDIRGPHILSDRPYKDSKVVFYRYGGHRLDVRTAPHGYHIPFVCSPTGEQLSDERVPFYRVPSWITDPLQHDQPGYRKKESVLLKGRYRVASAIKNSATGGIYKAEDLENGKTVVIREARPLLCFRDESSDAFTLLQKSKRVLERLAGTGLAPAFVDCFQEWEHLFLVEEYLQARQLWAYAMRLHLESSRQPSSCELFNSIRNTILVIMQGLQTVHRQGIVLRDFTKSNVLFTEDGQVKFVDFELSYELGSDAPPVSGSTPGYASPEQQMNLKPSVGEDYYALGALILDIITYSASGLSLNRSGVLRALDQRLDDLGFPRIVGTVVRGLIESDPAKRWNLAMVRDALEGTQTTSPGRDPLFTDKVNRHRDSESTLDLRDALKETIQGLSSFILSMTDYSRDDRLWPSCPEVFDTNPTSIQFGAAGTSYFLWRANSEVPRRVATWIAEHSSTRTAPPGMYIGTSGVALFLLDIGMTAAGEELLESSHQPDRIHELPGLYVGAAGWGLVNLHFWRKTGNRKYLDRALETGRRLVSQATIDAKGASWAAAHEVPLGFGYGPSGVAAFLLFLHAAQPSDNFLEIAVQAVDFDISHADRAGNRVNLAETAAGRNQSPTRPHIKYGSCGVGTAAIRLYALTAEPRFLTFARECVPMATSRFTNKLWQDYGSAGLGEFLIDMYQFTGDDGYLKDASYVAAGILPHRISMAGGEVFAGSDLCRISCSFGMGAGGIGVFLHRLLYPDTPRLLLLDELLPRHLPGRSDLVRVHQVAQSHAHVVLDVIGNRDRDRHADQTVRDSERQHRTITNVEFAHEPATGQGHRRKHRVGQVGNAKQAGGDQAGAESALRKALKASQEERLLNDLLDDGPDEIAAGV